MSATTPMPVTLLAFKPTHKGALRGFCKVRIGKALVIHDALLMISHGKAWINLPGKPRVDASGTAMRDENNKALFSPVMEWSDRATTDRFSAAVVEQIRIAHPDALADAS